MIYTPVDAILLARRKTSYVLRNFNKGTYYLFIFLVNAYYFGPIEDIFIPFSYSTPTGSMMNTILPGEVFLENDLAYGIRNPFTGKYAHFFNKPERGDVVEFKNRNVSRDEKSREVIHYLKRILALPGDTLMIKYALVYINGEFVDHPTTANLNSNFKPDASQHDPEIFPKGSGWNLDHYGPLIIPKEGQIVELDTGNIHLWRKLIENEGNKIEVTWSKIVINDQEQYKYVIKKNYYFMIGDNWYNSLDSRFWGFVAEEDIMAKITMIIWSRDTKIPLIRTDKLLNSILWERIGTIIK
ncbi:MAG: signal peptidase I [Ignavibacteria bacterium]|nr:signal peptidase I [Ignavibacteria bacterium]